MAKDIKVNGVTYTGVEKIGLQAASGGTVEAVFAEGTKSITENGTYDVTQFASAEVNVASGGSGETLQVKAVTYRPSANLMVTAIPAIKHDCGVIPKGFLVKSTNTNGVYFLTGSCSNLNQAESASASFFTAGIAPTGAKAAFTTTNLSFTSRSDSGRFKSDSTYTFYFLY